jgi:hypothetical protein
MTTSNRGAAHENGRRKAGRRPREGLCTASLRHRKCRNYAIEPTDRCHLHPRHFGVTVLRSPKPACLSRRGNVKKCQESQGGEMLTIANVSKGRPLLAFPNISYGYRGGT